MKQTLIISLLIFSSISYIIEAQEIDKILKESKSVQISFGIGAKYDISKPKDLEIKNPGFAFTFEVAKDFWNTGKNFIGIGIVGHEDTYGPGPGLTRDFSLILDVFYKRHSQISPKIAFEVDLGIGVFSNDIASFLSYFANLQVKYSLKHYEIFVKNNFRMSFPYIFSDVPWILTAGISITI